MLIRDELRADFFLYQTHTLVNYLRIRNFHYYLLNTNLTLIGTDQISIKIKINIFWLQLWIMFNNLFYIKTKLKSILKQWLTYFIVLCIYSFYIF